VLPYTSYTRDTPSCSSANLVMKRVVVFSVLLVNAHTWGLNSSYAVFLAYYLRSGTIDGASPLGFAFVGGLSISICTSPPFRGLKTLADRLSGQLFWFLQ
jgi:hypothetical protein